MTAKALGAAVSCSSESAHTVFAPAAGVGSWPALAEDREANGTSVKIKQKTPAAKYHLHFIELFLSGRDKNLDVVPGRARTARHGCISNHRGLHLVRVKSP